MRPTIYTWNLAPEKLGRLRFLCMRMNLRLRPVTAGECGLPLGSLPAEATEAEGEPLPFPEEMLLMAGLPVPQVHGFLDAMKRERIPTIALKAVLTPTNRAWDSLTLREELSREREALEGGKPSAHGEAQSAPRA